MPPSAPSGVMICLPIPSSIAEQIAVDGGESVESLHVTLAYVPGIGGDAELRKRLCAALELLAPMYGPIRGMIGGYGRFVGSETSDFKDVFYASFDSPGLEILRNAVMDTLFRNGFQASGKHGFTPHITLSYLDKGEEIPDCDLYGMAPFYIDHIALGDRDGIEEFEFSGSYILKGAPSASSVHVNAPMVGKRKKAKKADEEGGDQEHPVAQPSVQEPGWETPPEDNLEVGLGEKYSEELAKAALQAVGAPVKKSALVSLAKEAGTGVVPISKLRYDKQICYGVVLIPDTEDLQGDVISAEEIEKTAHAYMENARQIKDRHGKGTEAVPIESYIAPQELYFSGGPYGGQQVKKGSWVLGVKVADPELWRKIETGEYQGFSVGGVGVRDDI